jgi:hypothetical protein
MICTTLNAIHESYLPTATTWRHKLLSRLGKTEADNEPLSLLTLLDICGLDETLWCLRTIPEHDALWRHYAVDCAERVAHLLVDDRSRNALWVARRYALGQATDKELEEAEKNARAVSRTAGMAYHVWAATESASQVAARHAWAAAVHGAWCARDAAGAAKETRGTRIEARAAEQEWQTARLRKLLTDGAWSPVEGEK